MSKSEQLQIRITPEQKTALKRSARRAGLSVSAYVLVRVLPPARLRFAELTRALRQAAQPGFVLAEISDVLVGLTPAELPEAVVDPPPKDLSPYLKNYLSALVEQAAHHQGVAPPEWVADVEPLEEPRFIEKLAGLRLHLLASTPVPFRRRNLFVDSALGDRV